MTSLEKRQIKTWQACDRAARIVVWAAVETRRMFVRVCGRRIRAPGPLARPPDSAPPAGSGRSASPGSDVVEASVDVCAAPAAPSEPQTWANGAHVPKEQKEKKKNSTLSFFTWASGNETTYCNVAPRLSCCGCWGCQCLLPVSDLFRNKRKLPFVEMCLS